MLTQHPDGEKKWYITRENVWISVHLIPLWRGRIGREALSCRRRAPWQGRWGDLRFLRAIVNSRQTRIPAMKTTIKKLWNIFTSAPVALAVLLACLSIVASGSLAYFTVQETAHNVATTVTFDAAKMDNIYQNCTAKIEVQAHAVQVANNGDTVLDATGWPA